jgi:hypothetical protein
MSNFESLVVEHCENTVRNKVEIISQRKVSEAVLSRIQADL